RGPEERRVLRGRGGLGAHQRRAAQAPRRLRPLAPGDRAAARPGGPFHRLAHAARDRARHPRRPRGEQERHRPRESRRTTQPRMIRTASCLLLLLASCFLGAARAPAFPARAVSLIVPYAPGGLPDTIARTVGQKLSERWGQPVVIENRPGGNGVVAAQYLIAKPGDGYTLMATDIATFSINPYVYKSLPYEEKDFTFVSLTARAPLFLALNPSIPAATFPQFVALAKASPGKYSYGSSGIGSIMQLVMESVKATLGIDVLHVPYKGTGQSVPAAVSNQVSLVVSAYPSLQGFAKDGKLRLIAVTTAQRSPLAPQVSSIAET